MYSKTDMTEITKKYKALPRDRFSLSGRDLLFFTTAG